MAFAVSSARPLILFKFNKSFHDFSFRCTISPSSFNPSPPLLRLTTSRSPRHRSAIVIASAQSNFLRVIQTAWRIGKDGIEAGTNLIPNSVPRPVARVTVALAAVTIGLFLLKSFISTAFFVLAMMGFIYFVFIALSKDEGPSDSGGGGGDSSNSSRGPSTDEEAMEEVGDEFGQTEFKAAYAEV